MDKKIIFIGILLIILVGVVFLIFYQQPDHFLLKYNDNIDERFVVINNEITYKTFRGTEDGELCEIKYLISEKEKQELINTITRIDFFNLTTPPGCVVAVGPQYLNIALGEKFNSVDTRCPWIAHEVIYKLEEFTAEREAELRQKCSTDFIPRYSYCGIGTDKVRKVKETWQEGDKICICQSYENIVCK